MITKSLAGSVVSVCLSPTHTMAKPVQSSIKLIEGLGVDGDAHAGVTVKHRSRVRQDPTQPNLRQVHIVHRELHEELNRAGFDLSPGEMGENILTRGIDLLALPTDTILHIGESAAVKVTGLRNPCTQLDGISDGLMQAVLDRDEAGNLVRKSGIMGVVIAGGEVKPGDEITSELHTRPFRALEPV